LDHVRYVGSEHTPPRSSVSGREDIKVHGLTVNVVSSVVSGSPGLDDPIARQRIVLQFRIVKAILKYTLIREFISFEFEQRDKQKELLINWVYYLQVA
jgi:hypothetical protein